MNLHIELECWNDDNLMKKEKELLDRNNDPEKQCRLKYMFGIIRDMMKYISVNPEDSRTAGSTLRQVTARNIEELTDKNRCFKTHLAIGSAIIKLMINDYRIIEQAGFEFNRLGVTAWAKGRKIAAQGDSGYAIAEEKVTWKPEKNADNGWKSILGDDCGGGGYIRGRRIAGL